MRVWSQLCGYLLFLGQLLCLSAFPNERCEREFIHLDITRRNLYLNEFNVSRDLGHYDRMLSINDQPLVEVLITLNENSHWIDMGAGSRQALYDYLTRSHMSNPPWDPNRTPVALPAQRANVTAVAVVHPRDARTHPRMSTHEGYVGPPLPRLRASEISAQVLTAENGRADLITDMVGPLCYSHRPDRVLATYLEALKDEGTIFIAGSAVRDNFLGSVVQSTGEGQISFAQWLTSIPGIEVTATNENGTAYRIRITDRAQIQIPTLRLTHSDQGRPPIMTFAQLPPPAE